MTHSQSSFCPWCLKKTTHYIRLKNLVTRNIYECQKCKEKTVVCRYCSNMARSTDTWDDELCLEHNGTVANYETLNSKLEDILDYSELFKKKQIDLQKAAKISAAVIAGSVAFPVLLTYGLGGALGAEVLAGLGVVGSAGGLGGVASGLIANNYFGDIKEFKIEQVQGGAGDSVIFVDGFLTDGIDRPDDWITQLRKVYPNNPLYYIRWESKALKDIGKSLGGHVTNAAISNTVSIWAKKAATSSAIKLNPVGAGLTALGIINSPWAQALYKSEKVGFLLADIISRTNNQYILAGHSLGARVVFYTLKNLAETGNKNISEVHLLGGAVGNHEEDWRQCCKAVNGKINNYYSLNDSVLKYMYSAGTIFRSPPIGRNKITVSDLNLVNKDVSKFVSGHTTYLDSFSIYAIK